MPITQNDQKNKTTKKKPNHLKWAKDLNKQFSKEGKPLASKHKRRYLTSFVIRKTQIKTTVRYIFTLMKIALIKKTD